MQNLNRLKGSMTATDGIKATNIRAIFNHLEKDYENSAKQ